MKQSDKGIVLNRISYSETSFIVSIYTRKNGTQKFIFQGAKKKKIPFYPLMVGELIFYKRPDSELGKLTAFETDHLYMDLSFDPIKSMISFFVADVLNKCLKSEDQDEELFRFLIGFIGQINQADELSHIPLYFLTEFSKFLGICPNVLSEEACYFNIIDGEISDLKPTGEIYYREAVANLIARYLKHEYAMFPQNKTTRKEALTAMLHYYKVHIPRFNDLNSLAIIEELLYS